MTTEQILKGQDLAMKIEQLQKATAALEEVKNNPDRTKAGWYVCTSQNKYHAAYEVAGQEMPWAIVEILQSLLLHQLGELEREFENL
jgi:hypothetical protein